MDVQRRGTRYEGSLTREGDGANVPFAGTLELMAALERLEPDEVEAGPTAGRRADGHRP